MTSRSAGVVRTQRERFTIAEGTTRPTAELIDLDAATVAVLPLAPGWSAGEWLSPWPSLRRWCSAASRGSTGTRSTRRASSSPTWPGAGRRWGKVPRRNTSFITCATRTPPRCCSAKVPVHVVTQRLGHANPTVTLTVYAHVLSGSQRDAADVFAGLIGKAGQA